MLPCTPNHTVLCEGLSSHWAGLLQETEQVLTKTHGVKEGRFLFHLMEFVATVSADGAHTGPGERVLEREELFCRGEESSQ